MQRVGYQITFQTDDLRAAQHISKVLREKYGKSIRSSQAEVVAGSAAVTLISILP